MKYTMQEVSNKLDIATSALRYYDQQGLLKNIERNNSGHRIFSDHDLDNIKLICCLKQTGMSIKDIKSFLDLENEGHKTLSTRNIQLQKHKEDVISHIKKTQFMLEQIDKKIKYYSDACSAYENGEEVPCCTYDLEY